MATYTTLRIGSTGDEVKKLQASLGIKDDGIYGNQTAAAVKEYQKANGLSVDGIAGNQTLGKLYGGSTTTAPTTPTTQSQQDTSFKHEDYAKSDIVKQAEALLQQQIANKPGEYQSNWQAQLDETLDKILNREKFSYDLNGDALYQQYKDQYKTQGQLASMDVMGQAAAMNGGYGSSYEQTVGHQAYQGYLQKLNDRVPELYQLALNQYNREGQDLKDLYGLYADMDERDYGRHRDDVSDFNTELARLTEDARYLDKTDYDRYMDKTNMDYTMHRDGITDANTAKSQASEMALSMLSLGVMPSADVLASAGISSADAQAIAKKVLANEAKAEASKGGSGGTGGSGSGGSGNDNSGGYDTHGYTTEQIKSLQKAAGITADGIWGKQTQAAYDKGIRPGDYNEYADWESGDWGSYFSNIRQSEGEASADEELNYFIKNGLIPKKYVAAAASAVRGGKMGH